MGKDSRKFRETVIKVKKKGISKKANTKKMVQKGMSINEIAEEQDFTKSTIIKHIEEILDKKDKLDIKHLLPKKKDCEKIRSAFNECGWDLLKPAFEYLDEKFDYNTLKLVRAYYINL